MSGLRLERHHEPPAGDVLAAAAAVYERAFAEPPYSGSDSGTSFLDRVARYASRDGFRLTLAHADDDVAGLALSVRAFPGDWWRDRCAEELGPEREAMWLQPAIREVVHVAVSPDRRREGAGRLLTEEALDDPEVASVVLSCHPRAEAAGSLYLACGFEVLAEHYRTGPGQLGYRLLARRPVLPR